MQKVNDRLHNYEVILIFVSSCASHMPQHIPMIHFSKAVVKNAEKVLNSLNEEESRDNITLNVVQQSFFPEQIMIESGTSNCGAGMGMSPVTNKCSKSSHMNVLT